MVQSEDGPGGNAFVRSDAFLSDNAFLGGIAAEIEAHVARSGWDQRPTLFALVRASQFATDEPKTLSRLKLRTATGEELMPVEQEALPDGALDEVLAQLAWPASVAGCALSQEIVILPPSAQDALDALAGIPDDDAAIALAAAHPDRREARLVVAVLRDGTSAGLLRLHDSSDGLLTAPDLAPNLVAALVATLSAD